MVLAGAWHSASVLLNNLRRSVVTALDRVLDALSLDVLGEET